MKSGKGFAGGGRHLLIRFFSIDGLETPVTGGEIYNLNVLNILKAHPLFDAAEGHLGSEVTQNKNPLHLFRHFRESLKYRDTDVAIFDSSRCVRFMPVLLLYKYILRKKTLAIHHHFVYETFSGLHRKIYRIIERSFLRIVDKVVSPSPYIRDLLGNIRKKEDILYWRIPFESEPTYKPVPERGHLVYAGTLEARKGLHFLLEAMKELKKGDVNVELKIIGKGVDENYVRELKQIVNRNKLSVEFCGFVSKEIKERILASSDLFVFPSQLEGFGMVLVEAQTYGLPIVCFNNSAMSYTIKDGENGYLVATGDSQGMAERIRKIVSDRELRDRMSEAALKNAQSQMRQEEFRSLVLRDMTKFGA